MKEEKILRSLKNSIEKAPIDILDRIKEEPRTKMLKHDDITRQDTRKLSLKKLMSYAATAAVFLFVFLGWQFQTKIPDSRVYLDVNPSIEIVTNRQDKVIDLIAENADGKKLTDDLQYKGKTVYQITDEILDRMMYEHYLNEEQEYLLLSVYNKNQVKAEQQKQVLDKRIHEHLEAKELKPVVLSQKLDKTSTIESYAKEFGISVSKMTFIRNLIILNPELRTEDLVDLSIGELVKLSQGMGLELEKIIDSSDLDRIQSPISEPEPEESLEQEPGNITPIPEDEDERDDDDLDDYDVDDDDDDDKKEQLQNKETSIITPAEAKSIALSIAKGTITDFDFDEDDLEYEVEIELGDLEYEIVIDARTGKLIEVEIDD